MKRCYEYVEGVLVEVKDGVVKYGKKGAAAGAAIVPMFANATSVYDPLTTAVDASTVVTAMFAVAAIIVLIPVAKLGIHTVIGMIRGR